MEPLFNQKVLESLSIDSFYRIHLLVAPRDSSREQAKLSNLSFYILILLTRC